MSRALLYCVLFGTFLLSVNAASMMCVKGRTSLTPSPGSPAREWCSSAPDGCTVDFAFTFDAESPNAQRWPLKASVGPLGNQTALVALFPELSDIGFQCAPSGDIVATTRIGSNNERLRFIWGYSGVSSSSCAFTMSSVNLDADFVQFQALLAYSGYMSMFDAGSTTNDRRYSIAQLSSSAIAPHRRLFHLRRGAALLHRVLPLATAAIRQACGKQNSRIILRGNLLPTRSSAA